jgi:hypothetical protein
MTRWSLLAVLMAVAGLTASSSLDAQRAPTTMPNEPGLPTVARMYILNSGADEAVPVTIHSGSDVQAVTVMGLPDVSLAANASVTARAARQTWEYREITVATGQDAVSALNAAGLEGWEAVGQTGGTGASRVLMKRPR